MPCCLRCVPREACLSDVLHVDGCTRCSLAARIELLIGLAKETLRHDRRERDRRREADGRGGLVDGVRDADGAGGL